jgi:NTP pyrophosphatase (non-canonical NTP hydrolase)
MSAINKITEALVNFRNERDWKQFHNAKDLAIAINVEASELLQLFLWKEAQEPKDEKIKEELADVFAFAFLLAHEKGFDIEEIILDKLKINAAKYPIEKAKGNAKKYNEL